ncbi:hypothetical protein OVA24_03780 [Luteolibacter sp. SL250]|uniref:hypothetical protein n=1 Tax=Luteolibacter sp. SL250 TaxID=2995170 RepID=UPI00226E5F31|nr:hypothetical protein [Luteolibacter sp. SL250]WAC20497.1 hypothetical protein OVA24_03780 [Luteolibacter sp. SL250]
MHSVRFIRLFQATGLAVILSSPASAEPLVKNSGFDKELGAWECDEGKIVADPDEKGNSLLEVELDGGVFGLTQDFKWPAGKKSLALSFRVKASTASKDSPVQWRLRLYDAEGNSGIMAGGKITESGGWIIVTKTIPRPEGGVTSLMLESNRGEGKLWIDDLKVE